MVVYLNEITSSLVFLKMMYRSTSINFMVLIAKNQSLVKNQLHVTMRLLHFFLIPGHSFNLTTSICFPITLFFLSFSPPSHMHIHTSIPDQMSREGSMFSCKSTTHTPPPPPLLPLHSSYRNVPHGAVQTAAPLWSRCKEWEGNNVPYFWMLLRVSLSLLNSSMLCRFPSATRCWKFQSHTHKRHLTISERGCGSLFGLLTSVLLCSGRWGLAGLEWMK